MWHSVIELSVIVWIHQCAYDFGEWVTDSLGKVLQEGYIMGPFYENDVPFEANRFSGLMAKLKPDGSARLILNLSKGDPYFR